MVSDAVIKGKALNIGADAFAAFHLLQDDEFNKADLLHDRLNNLKTRPELDDDSLRRIATTALDMLRDAHNALEEANRHITTQRSRIEHLENIATTDELTTLVNRRGFSEAFDRELDRTNRGQTKGGLLLMIDLDNFKVINDTYGHAAGDAALRLVADTLKTTVRRMDIAARLGGDEFVILFSNAEVMGAVDRAQQLAMRLNSLTLRWQGEKIPVRASIGMRAYAAGDTVETVLHGADCAMYDVKAKRAKKEKVRA